MSASIYAAGQLDEVLTDGIVPFWQHLEPPAEAYLWLVRYDLGGEHLAIRVHGPDTLGEPAWHQLEHTLEPVLASQPEATPERGKSWWGNLRKPPLDPEDRQVHDDRTLSRTTYRRSPVSLGARPLIDDDTFATLLTRGLSQGCAELLTVAAEGELANERQSTLLRLLITGLTAIEERSDYLAYHRDWLIRYPSLKVNVKADAAETILGRFDQFCARRPELLERLSAWSAAAWNDGATFDSNGDFSPAVQALVDHVASFGDDPTYRSDPYAPSPVFPSLFKLFHGIANQLGVSPSDEAYTHHLLLRSVAPESTKPFSLIPVAQST
ncbi:MAG: lantibiotic dehydratase C-terminal domain-containing protein [Acidobacteriota bacterium]